MKRIISGLIGAAGLVALVYVLASFAMGSFDVALWTEEGRGTTTLSGFWAMVIGFFIGIAVSD